ncbi:Floral homeotic protein APETALA 1-1 [Platanthera guangdongensis]|uniref:Floral homeotic protein APETALA 1-1 n=1 Tax=Platanthera guangdongensis TaxID=2320717 RepID=A0ABR2LX15_9ASPA
MSVIPMPKKHSSPVRPTPRHLMGEQLDSLSFKELQHLDQQLESSLKHIRSKKIQLMLDSIAELQKKEKMLQEQNKNMQKEIRAKEKARASAQCVVPWEQQNQTQYSSSPPHALLSDSLPTPTSRNFQGRDDEEEAAQPQLRLGTALLPPWMFTHLNGC